MMTALTALSKIILTTEVSERHFEELHHFQAIANIALIHSHHYTVIVI